MIRVLQVGEGGKDARQELLHPLIRVQRQLEARAVSSRGIRLILGMAEELYWKLSERST